MSTLQEPSPFEVTAAALEAYGFFVAGLASGEVADFESFCRDHAELEDELRRLHARVSGTGEPQLGHSITRRIREEYGSEVDPDIVLGSAQDAATKDAPGEAPGEAKASVERTGEQQRYRLEGEVARGGQGAILRVWDEDLHRHLAMKVVLTRTGENEADGDSRADPHVMKRFLEEAQVTGQLDHPGIVPVHELGFDQEGRVFFTMKLVQGEDLSSVFRKVKEGVDGWTRARALGVMQKVCEAMAYAHHKSVIHRDLKPDNVMVGRFGAVYVMDWGLARVLGQRDQRNLRVQVAGSTGEGATEETPSAGGSRSPLVTMDGDIVGTPAYMSPEQARGDLQAMGPQSDVYAAGAMLYTLLSGHVPYVPEDSTVNNIDVWRAVTKGPPAPLHTLTSDVPPELEAICQKAMEREPSDRYPNMSELGADLQAFMENRVVSAYETGALLEFRKWVQRNRGLATACAAALLLLVGGLAVSLVLRARAVRAEETAKAEAVNASQSAQAAGQISDFLIGLFRVVDPGEARGNTVTAREILDRGAERIDAELADQPEVQSALMESMGIVYTSLGLYDAAVPLFERALHQREEVFGRDHPLVGESLNDLGHVLRIKADYGTAVPLLRRALEVRSGALGEGHADVAESTHELAVALMESGEYVEAEPLFRQALSLRRQLLGRHPDVAETLNELAFNLYYSGDKKTPGPMLREALELRQETQGVHPDVAESMNNLALYLYETGEPQEAEEMMRAALDLKRQVLGKTHPEVAMGLNNLAFILHDQGELELAEAMYREALGINRELLGAVHPNIAQAQNNLAFVLNDEGHFAGAQELFLSSLEIYRQVHGNDHPAVDTARTTATQFMQGRVVDLEHELGGEHPALALAQSELGELYLQAGDFDRAEDLLSRAHATLDAERGSSAPETQVAVTRLVRLFEASGRPEIAGEYRLLEIEAEER